MMWQRKEYENSMSHFDFVDPYLQRMPVPNFVTNHISATYHHLCDTLGGQINHTEYPIMTSSGDIQTFIDRQIHLLQQERDTEVEESNLLLSNCAPRLLERKGLAILNLSISNVQVGLGGRRWVLRVYLKRSSPYDELQV